MSCLVKKNRTRKNLGIAPRTRRKAALKANMVLRPERILKGGRCVAQRILSNDCRWQSLYEIIGFADSASLRPHSCGASWRDKKLPAGGTQPKRGQGYRPKVLHLRAADCLAVPQGSLCRPSSVRAAPCHLPPGEGFGTFSIPHRPEKGNRNPLREAGGGGFSIQGIRFTERPSSC